MYCALWKPWTRALGTGTKKKKLFFPEIAWISSAAIVTSFVIQTSEHFNLTLAEEPGAYLSLKNLLLYKCFDKWVISCILSIPHRGRNRSPVGLSFGLLFCWCLQEFRLLSAWRLCPSQLKFYFLWHFFCHFQLSRLKEHWSKNCLIRLQENYRKNKQATKNPHHKTVLIYCFLV